MDEPLLVVQDLRAGYAGMTVLHGVDLQVRPGQLVAVLGANGAGKSTLLRTLAGLLPPHTGSIRFGGTEVGALPVEGRVRAGIVLVPEGRALFPTLTVRENLIMGAFTPRPSRAVRAAVLDEVLAIFPTLRGCLGERAGSLSGGQARMVALGRALMARPALLLLDEPSQGLAPLLVRQLFAAIDALVRARGLSVVLVEQSTDQALALASHCYVLEHGRVALSGTPAEVDRAGGVRRSYLGGE